jgi:hypothetical protein
VFVGSVAFLVILIWLTSIAGHTLARRQWVRPVIDSSRDGFAHTDMLIRNDGLEDRHLGLSPDDPERQRLAAEGLRTIEELLSNMEELLDVPDRSGTPTERLNRLRPLFAH